MIIRTLPSLCTVGNLFLGIMSILLAFNRQFDAAALTVIICMLLDGLDGRLARMLNAQSEFGKQLDSLSDIISFGLAPAFIMYGLVLSSLDWIGIAITAIFPVCGALRLARFNVSAAATPNYFVGLPITAAGGVLATMALYQEFIPAGSSEQIVFPLGMVGLSYLMVSRIKYPNFKKVGIPKSAYYMIPLILIAVIAVFVFYRNQAAKLVFVPLVLYAVYGLAKRRTKRRKQPDSAEPAKPYQP